MTVSVGHRQRLAIARAIAKNAPVLLLNKATCALDAENERLRRQALDRMADQRTTIVIAHRLATVQKADRIVVMENGRIVEQVCTRTSRKAPGTGLYARFVAVQFSRRHGEDGKAAY